MYKNFSLFIPFLSVFLFISTACSNDSDSTEMIQNENVTESQLEPSDTITTNDVPMPLAGKVTFFNQPKTDNNYVLINDAGNDTVYIMDKAGKTLKS